MLIRYQSKSFTSLASDVEEKIIKKYTKPDRAVEIQLLKNLIFQIPKDGLNETEARATLLGALIFLEKFIKQTYGKYTCYFWSANNSDLYVYIKDALSLNAKNTLDNPEDPTQFICLTQFLKYVETKKYCSFISNEKLAILKEFVDVAKIPFEEKFSQLHIKLISKQSKHEKIAHLRKKYENACAQVNTFIATWHKLVGRNAERNKSLEILEGLSKHLQTSNASEEECDFVINGAICVALAGIENEYRGLSAPTNSDLYKILQKEFGISSSSKHIESTEAFLAAYNEIICKAPFQLDHWNTLGVEKAAIDKAKTDILALQTELAQIRKGVHISNDRRLDIIINQLFNTLAGSITQGGVLLAVYQLTTLVTASSSLSFFNFMAMASPQTTLLTLSAIYAAKHLHAPVSTLISSFATPAVESLLIAPVNAALGKPSSMFQAVEKLLTEEEFQLFDAHYYLCTDSEKEILDASIDPKKLENAKLALKNSEFDDTFEVVPRTERLSLSH